MAPTLVASYPVYANANNTSTLTTPSFTPSAGEVLVIKMATWDTNVSMGTPTGGSQTYTSRVINAPGGFAMWTGIYTAVISGSPGSMTVSSTPSASCWHSMVVERWSGAQLAATPATGSGTGNGTTPSVTITTTGTDSVVSWVNGDINSRSPSTRAYLSSATEDGLQDGSAGANSVTYYAYQSAASAGSQTMGMSAPASQRWVLAGIEVQAAAASTDTGTLSATLPVLTGAVSGTLTASGSVTPALPPATGSLSGTATDSGTLAATLPVLTGSVSGAGTASGTLSGALPPLTGSSSATAMASGSLAAALQAPTADLAGSVADPGTLAASLPPLTGTGGGTLSTAGSLTAPLPALQAALQGSAGVVALQAIRVTVNGLALSKALTGPASVADPGVSGPGVPLVVTGPAVRRTVTGIGV